jgi:hypothetical protein
MKSGLAIFALLLGAIAFRSAPASAAPPGPRCGPILPLAHRGLFSGGFERVKFQHMASYCFDRHGMFTVVLDDGSIWRQWPDDVRYAYWRARPSHYRVLMRGDDENGFLTVENDGLEYKVRRVG